MRCPMCKSLNTHVTNTLNIGDTVRRYRKCLDCERYFASIERIEVVKSGRPKMIRCRWCGKELRSLYLTYNDMTFCRNQDDQCLKNFLFEQHKKDITVNSSKLDMGEVAEIVRLQVTSM